MKRCAWTLVIAFALAACFLAGTAVYVRAARDGLRVESVETFGELPSGSGWELRQRAELAQHLVWETGYDPASGGQETASRWLFEAEGPRYPLEAEIYVSSYDSWSWYADSEPAEMPDWARGIYDSMAERHLSDGETEQETVPAGVMSDRLEINIDVGLAARTVGSFCIPMPEDATLSADRTMDIEERFTVSLDDNGLDNVSGCCVYAPDGCIYLALNVIGSGGERPSAELLPGGDWGVWRVPVNEADWSGGRLTGALRLDLAELVYSLGGSGWEDAALGLSEDSGELLLYTKEAGALWLTAIERESGRVKQRLLLLDSGAMAEKFTYVSDLSSPMMKVLSRGDLAVLVNSYGEFCAAVMSGGVWHPLLADGVDDLPVPDFASRGEDGALLREYTYYTYYFNCMQDFKWDGEYLAVLTRLRLDVRGGLECDWEPYVCLSVYEPGGGCVYAGWIKEPVLPELEVEYGFA